MTCILTENVTYPEVLFIRFSNAKQLYLVDGFDNIEQRRATRKRRPDNVSSRRWFNVNSLS